MKKDVLAISTSEWKMIKKFGDIFQINLVGLIMIEGSSLYFNYLVKKLSFATKIEMKKNIFH